MKESKYVIDSRVRCFVCDNEQDVSFEFCMRNAAWPSCHGQTMELIETNADVDKVMNKIFSVSWRNFTLDPKNYRRKRGGVASSR